MLARPRTLERDVRKRLPEPQSHPNQKIEVCTPLYGLEERWLGGPLEGQVACQHLVQDDPHGPNVNRRAVILLACARTGGGGTYVVLATGEDSMQGGGVMLAF